MGSPSTYTSQTFVSLCRLQKWRFGNNIKSVYAIETAAVVVVVVVAAVVALVAHT